MSYNRTISGRKIDSFEPVDVETTESPRSGLGFLAYSENGTTTQTTISTAAVGCGFATIAVEPSDRTMLLRWEMRLAIVTAPGATYGGNLDGILWEDILVGSSVTVVELDRDPLRVYPSDVINANRRKASGSIWLEPFTTHRVFSLGAGITKDNVAGTLVGGIRNQPSAKTRIWMEAG